jgi:lambda family phage portal protein
MNWIDNTIAWINPRAGLARARYRVGLQLVRKYEGADLGRKSSGWSSAGTSANAENLPATSSLRNASRNLFQNDPAAKKIVSDLVAALVGTGIKAKWNDDTTQSAWDHWWAHEVDADQDLDGNGLLAMIARTMILSGETPVRFRPRRIADGLTVPLQLQVLEPDYIDGAKDGPMAGTTNRVVGGVELDALGRRRGYWMFAEHPGEAASLFNRYGSSRFVPASEIVLFYDKLRPGQLRGVPMLHAVISHLREIGDLRAAELMKRKVEACFAAFVETDDESEQVGVSDATQVNKNPREETLRPGLIKYLKPGQQVSFGTPSNTGGSTDWVKFMMHLVASGAGSTYQRATGDLSQVNFSSGRMGDIQFRSTIEQLQWLVLVPKLRQIARQWAVTAKVAGVIRQDAAETPVDWTTPEIAYLDPLKEINAETMAIKAGLVSWSESLRKKGYDPEVVMAEIAAERQKMAELGIELDIRAAAANAASKPPKDADEDKES